METTVFPLIAGCTFILLGRWTYRNPKRLYPNALYSDPDNPVLKNWVKVFAMLLIFVGSYAGLAAVSGLFLRGVIVISVTLPVAIVATWLLRPQLVETPRSVVAPADASEEHLGFLTTKGKWFFYVTIVAALALMATVFVFIWLRR
jgi:hypothetical protein